jgi:hypothetical protein
MVGREGVDRRGRGGGKGQTENRKEQSLTTGEGEGQKKPQPRAGSLLHNYRARTTRILTPTSEKYITHSSRNINKKEGWGYP